MSQSIFRAAGQGRRLLAALAVAAMSLGLHGLVLRWGASSMRHASPVATPAVVMATLPQPQQQRPHPGARPSETLRPVPPPVARRLPPRPILAPHDAARADRPARAALPGLPAGLDAVAPVAAPVVATPIEMQTDADADAAVPPAAPGPPAASTATVEGREADEAPHGPARSANGSEGALAIEPGASAAPPAASSTVPPPIESVAVDLSGPALAPPPESIELRFDAYLEHPGGDTRIGNARFALHAADGRYRMALEASGPLSRFAYASSGLLGARGFEPHRFSESRRVAFRARVARRVTFVAPSSDGPVPSHDRAVDSPEEANGEPSTEAIMLQVPPGTQDRLSVLFQLWLLTRDHPERLAEGREIVLSLASMKGHDRATFRVGPVEPFASGSYPVAAVRLTRVSGPARASGIEVWLAAQPPHLPVGLRYVERDRAVRFVATGTG